MFMPINTEGVIRCIDNNSDKIAKSCEQVFRGHATSKYAGLTTEGLQNWRKNPINDFQTQS